MGNAERANSVRNTEYSKNLRNTAQGFTDLIDSNMEPFDDLVHRWPNAGSFNLGVWIERIADDRRNAIVAHAAHLRTIFGEMGNVLSAVASEFDQVDEGNAKAVNDIVNGGRKTSEDKMKIWNTDRENVEQNHAGGARNAGDGWSQNVNVAFDPAGSEQETAEAPRRANAVRNPPSDDTKSDPGNAVRNPPAEDKKSDPPPEGKKSDPPPHQQKYYASDQDVNPHKDGVQYIDSFTGQEVTE